MADIGLDNSRQVNEDLNFDSVCKHEQIRKNVLMSSTKSRVSNVIFVFTQGKSW